MRGYVEKMNSGPWSWANMGLGNATPMQASTGSVFLVRNDSDEHHIQPEG